MTTQLRKVLTLTGWAVFVALTLLSLVKWPLPLTIIGATVILGGLAALVDVAAHKHQLAELFRVGSVTIGIVVLALFAMLASNRELSAPVQVAALVFAARISLGSVFSRMGGAALGSK